MTKKQNKQKNKSAQKKTGNRKQTSKTNVLKVNNTHLPIKGNGGYVQDIGTGIGSWLGGKAADLFTKITGLGEYKVKQNSLVKPSDPPILSNTPAATRVQHREYICDISSSIGWLIRSFPINPGIATTFPWLSSVAGSFEQFRFHGLIFEFKSTSATALNSIQTNLGTVIMATEYDALNPPFINKREMENYTYSSSFEPSVSGLHPVECARDVTVLSDLYVRSTMPLETEDLRFSDLGSFQIATIGMQANTPSIGELWCTYDVELIKPKLPDAFTSTPPVHMMNYTGSGITIPTADNIFGSMTVPRFNFRGTGAALGIEWAGNNLKFLVSGRYMLSFMVNGTAGGTWTGATFAYANGISAYNLFLNNSVPSFQLASTSGTWVCSLAIDVEVTTLYSTPTLTVSGLSWNTGTSASTSFDLIITPLPQGFSKPLESLPEKFRLRQLEALVSSINQRIQEIDFRDDEEHQYIEDLPYSNPVLTRQDGLVVSRSFVTDALRNLVSTSQHASK